MNSCFQEEFPYLFPSLLSSLSVRFLDQELALAPGSDGKRNGCRFLRPAGPDCMCEQAMVQSKCMSQRFAQVAQQVPTIANLNGLGGESCNRSS